MIDYELFSKIKNLKEQHGLTPAQISRELSLDPRTVAKWLEEDRFKQRKSTSKKSKLDPFKKDILRMLTAHPYSAAQILQRIQEMGFDGGYSIVKGYVRAIRPKHSPAYLTLSFAPGECAQSLPLRRQGWIGGLSERSRSAQPPGGSAFLSWSPVTAG